MKTTVDLPDDILHRAKVLAAQRRTTLRQLILAGLQSVLDSEAQAPRKEEAIARLQAGYYLGGQPLSRDETHARL